MITMRGTIRGSSMGIHHHNSLPPLLFWESPPLGVDVGVGLRAGEGLGVAPSVLTPATRVAGLRVLVPWLVFTIHRSC